MHQRRTFGGTRGRHSYAPSRIHQWQTDVDMAQCDLLPHCMPVQMIVQRVLTAQLLQKPIMHVSPSSAREKRWRQESARNFLFQGLMESSICRLCLSIDLHQESINLNEDKSHQVCMSWRLLKAFISDGARSCGCCIAGGASLCCSLTHGFCSGSTMLPGTSREDCSTHSSDTPSTSITSLISLKDWSSNGTYRVSQCCVTLCLAIFTNGHITSNHMIRLM
jgi:hypothetical protein